MEEIRHHDKIAIDRELISNELRVDEPVADDIRESLEIIVNYEET